MTHFIGAVIVPQRIPVGYTTETRGSGDFVYQTHKPSLQLNAYLGHALAQFSEDLEMAPYCEMTREEVIAKGRAEIEQYKNGLYAEYLADPVAYAADCMVPNHLTYLRYEFPQRLNWTDQQVWEEEVKWRDDVRADGSVWSTSNPEGYWDWWTIGGRWEETYRERQGETVAAFCEIARDTLTRIKAGENLRPDPEPGWPVEEPDRLLPWWFPQNIVIPRDERFEWIKQGDVGWFGTRSEAMTEAGWIELLLDQMKDCMVLDRVVFVDFHI